MSLYSTFGMKDGDMSLTNGTITIKTDLDALADKINTALSTIKGELDDESIGVDYYNIIFSNTPLSMKVKEFSRVILSIDGVKACRFVSYEKDPKTNTWSFYFEIDSVFGTINLSKSAETI